MTARIVFLVRVPAARTEEFLRAYENIRYEVAAGVPGHILDQVCQALGEDWTRVSAPDQHPVQHANQRRAVVEWFALCMMPALASNSCCQSRSRSRSEPIDVRTGRSLAARSRVADHRPMVRPSQRDKKSVEATETT